MDTRPSSEDPEAERASYLNARRHLGLFHLCSQGCLDNLYMENSEQRTLYECLLYHTRSHACVWLGHANKNDLKF